MEEIALLIKAKYAGNISEMSSYMSVVIQTSIVLISGIVLWRMSNVIHKKKLAQRSRNEFFDTAYSKGWKRK